MQWNLYTLAQENEIYVLLEYLPKIAAWVSAEHTLWRGATASRALRRTRLPRILASWFHPKKNTRAKNRSSRPWGNMLRAFRDHPEFALPRYHKRSNSESTFSAKKRKFGAAVRSKDPVAQKNEEHLKWIAYNLSVLSRARFELGLKPKRD